MSYFSKKEKKKFFMNNFFPFLLVTDIANIELQTS